jgi:hypothetical protein
MAATRDYEKGALRMRRLAIMIAVLVAAAALTAGFASPAGAYGRGASHSTWQVAVSMNCNSPSLCAGAQGGFWGWVEFDQWSDGTITGDAELSFCGHTSGGGGAGAGHEAVDITAAHLDPITGDFVIDSASDSSFEGDTGIPYTPGHYANHLAPGITQVIQVSYRAAR